MFSICSFKYIHLFIWQMAIQSLDVGCWMLDVVMSFIDSHKNINKIIKDLLRIS